MIARRPFLAGLIGSLGATALKAGAAAPAFRRGIAIHSLMNWGHRRPDRPRHYTDDPFSGAEHMLPDALLANVAAAGFDFVRLTLDPGPFLDLDGPPRDALDRRLLATIRRLHGFGLAVLVDLHPNTQVRTYDPVTWLGSESDPMVARYTALLRRIARLLGGLGTPSVAFELMNEPPYGYHPAGARRWQSLQRSFHDAARAEAPALRLVLTGARGGSPAGLLDVDPAPFRGSAVFYSFHYYEPHVFTHEGVMADEDGTRSWRYMSDLPYPTDRVPREVVLATIASNVDQDTGLDPDARSGALRAALATADDYLASGFGPAQVAKDFDGVLGWARSSGVDPGSILLGEFGVTRTYGRYRAADPVSRAAWLHDVRTAAETRGFRWALWELKGSGGMATVETDEATTLDGATLQALGLKEGT